LPFELICLCAGLPQGLFASSVVSCSWNLPCELFGFYWMVRSQK
jgi:hypothetical protein